MEKSKPKIERRQSNKIKIGHTKLTYGYLIAKEVYLVYLTYGTRLVIKRILMECHQYKIQFKKILLYLINYAKF